MDLPCLFASSRYRKYKPLKKPAVCNSCHGHSVMKAYHKFCEKCSTSKDVCPCCTVTWKEIKVLDAASAGGGANNAAAESNEASESDDESEDDSDDDNSSVLQNNLTSKTAEMSVEEPARVSLGVCLEVRMPFAQQMVEGVKTVETRRYALPDELFNVPLQLFETVYDDAAQGASLPAHVPEGSVAGPRTDFTGWAFGEPKAFPDMRLLPYAITINSCELYESHEAWNAGRKEHCVEASSVHEWDGNGEMFAWKVAAVTPVQNKYNGTSVPQLDRRLRSLFNMTTSAEGSSQLLVSKESETVYEPVPPPPPAVHDDSALVSSGQINNRAMNVHGRAPVVK